MAAATGVSEPAAPARPRWMTEHVDLVVIGAWAILVAALGFSRADFSGDGLRHLYPIVRDSRPSLGEPRWLFFPALLFALLRPLVAVGLVTTVEGLTRPMMAATVLCGIAYLLSLRICLRSLGIGAPRRAAGLAVGALSTGLFAVATNLMEPIFAASLALGGLAFLAHKAADPQSSDDARRNAVLVAVAAIAAASLLYQGVILAVGLIPIFARRSTLRDRRLWLGAAAILAAVPIVSTCTLALAGNSVGRAFSRITQGEENALYRSYLKKSGLIAYLTALVGGPPQGLIGLLNFHGFNGLLADLRTPGERGGAVMIVLRLGAGLALVAAGTLAAVRRRDFTLLLGLGALLILPLVRHQQYGYVKYYVLFPVLLALAAARAPVPVASAIAGLLLLANGTQVMGEVSTTQRLRIDRAAAYAQADAQSCWVTSGWGPPVGFLWPGRVAPVLGTLAGGSGEDPQMVVSGAHATLTRRLEDCFCRSSGVFTDDFHAASKEGVEDIARQFQYTDLGLDQVLLPAGHGSAVSRVEPIVYRFSGEDQQRVCRLVSVTITAR